MSAALDRVKLCKDCAHHRENRYRVLFWNVRGASCLDKCAAFPDLVTGEAKKFCDIEREYGDKCGPEGKLWQTRP